MNTPNHGRLLASHGPLSNNPTLELCKGAEHLHHHAARKRLSVNRFGKTSERCALMFYALKDTEQIDKTSGEAVHLVDKNDVARTNAI